jgi:hypothetical protein
MRNRRRLIVTLVLVAILLMIGAIVAFAAALSPVTAGPAPADRYYQSYLTPTDLLDVADTTVDGGTYKVTYAMDVHFAERTSAATLICGLKDPNHVILRFSPDSVRRIRPSARPQHVEFSGIYELPPISLGIRCHTTVAGLVSAQFSNITLTTEQG